MNTDSPSADRRPSFAPILTLRRFLTRRKHGRRAPLAGQAAALLLAAALGAWALDSGGALSAPRAAAPATPDTREASPAAAAPLPVAAERVVRSAGYRRTRRFTGELVPHRASELGFELAGKLAAVHVDDGDLVERGAVLATLDTARLDARRRELEAGRAQAAARLAELVAGPREEALAIARADLAEVDEELELARTMHARRADLARRQAVSREDADAVQRTVDVLEARREAAAQRLAELERGTREEVVDAQRAALARIDAELASVDVELDKSALRAPFAGVVAARRYDEGAVLDAGRPVLRLVEHDALELRVGVPVELAPRLAGEEGVRLVAGDRELTGVVRAVLPEVDRATRTATVVVVLQGRAARDARPGETVELLVDTEFAAEGYWVDTDALRRSHRGLWAAYALVEDAARTDSDARVVERREVEVLYTDGGRALVRGALDEGEWVLSGGAHRVVPGMRVRIARDAEAAR